GQTLSHSYMREFRPGSPIQSYWPCITLWPISMLSRILEMLSEATARGEAGDLELALLLHDGADVPRVLLAELADQALPDGVDLVAERLDLLEGQLVVRLLV